MTIGDYFDGGEYESFGVYPFLDPARMRFIAMLHSKASPAIKGRFRYCELGCGQSMSLLLNAVRYPEATFVGVDFSSSAIARASELASSMGLRNIHLICSDFAAFAAKDLEPFDFIVLHGVWTWVGREVQRDILDILRQRLSPGGVVCVSANILFGWGGVMPLQHYLLCASSGASPAQRPALTQELLEKLAEAPHIKGVQSLADIARKSPSYFSHEYLAPAWMPTTLLQMNREFELAQLNWIGPARVDHLLADLWVPAAAASAVPEGTCELSRLSAYDALMSTNFRVELFGSGNSTLDAERRRATLDEYRLHVMQRTDAGTRLLTAVSIVLPLTDLLEKSLLALLERAPFECAELMDLPLGKGSAGDAAYYIACGLLASGLCHVSPNSALGAQQRDSIAMLNAGRISLAAEGHEITTLISPLSAQPVPVDAIDLANLISRTRGGSAEELAVQSLRRQAARARTIGSAQHDDDTVLDRMVARACAVWPNSGGKRLKSFGIEI